MAKPYPSSYWVYQDKLLAGYYPGDSDPAIAREKLCALLDSGIRAVINLMEEDELECVDKSLIPYEPMLMELAAERGIELKLYRFSIKNLYISTVDVMQDILKTIDHHVFALDVSVYVHCWAGEGRTGTVIGCWLMEHGISDEEHVLMDIVSLRLSETESMLPALESSDQEDFVIQWSR